MQPDKGRHRKEWTVREQLAEAATFLAVLVLGTVLMVVPIHWIWEAL